MGLTKDVCIRILFHSPTLKWNTGTDSDSSDIVRESLQPMDYTQRSRSAAAMTLKLENNFILYLLRLCYRRAFERACKRSIHFWNTYMHIYMTYDISQTFQDKLHSKSFHHFIIWQKQDQFTGRPLVGALPDWNWDWHSVYSANLH